MLAYASYMWYHPLCVQLIAGICSLCAQDTSDAGCIDPGPSGILPLFLLRYVNRYFLCPVSDGELQPALIEDIKLSKITETVALLAEPIVKKYDCELWNIEFVTEAGNKYLRVYIDRPEGISIDHCEAVSRDLDPVLDEHDDLFPGSYTFEVSSAGVERLLRGPTDFFRFENRYVEVKLYKSKNGKKTYLGNLACWNEDKVELIIFEQLHSFDKAEVASVRLRLDPDISI